MLAIHHRHRHRRCAPLRRARVFVAQVAEETYQGGLAGLAYSIDSSGSGLSLGFSGCATVRVGVCAQSRVRLGRLARDCASWRLGGRFF